VTGNAPEAGNNIGQPFIISPSPASSGEDSDLEVTKVVTKPAGGPAALPRAAAKNAKDPNVRTAPKARKAAAKSASWQRPPPGELRQAEGAQYSLDLAAATSRVGYLDRTRRGVVVGAYEFPCVDESTQESLGTTKLPVAAFFVNGGMVFRPAAIPPKGRTWALPNRPTPGLFWSSEIDRIHWPQIEPNALLREAAQASTIGLPQCLEQFVRVQTEDPRVMAFPDFDVWEVVDTVAKDGRTVSRYTAL
jgi:hypothetical protein